MPIKKRLHKKFSFLVFEGGNGASEEIIQDAENKLGLKFPSDYRDYLMEFGWLEVEHYEFFGVGSGIPKYLDLKLVASEEWGEGGLYENLLPIWNNGGGDLYCIDLKQSTNDKSIICAFYHENRQTEMVATSFENWLTEKLAELARSKE